MEFISNDIDTTNTNNDDNDNDERKELTNFWLKFNNDCNTIRKIIDEVDNNSNTNNADDTINNLKQLSSLH
jgi:hypothetical protein